MRERALEQIILLKHSPSVFFYYLLQKVISQFNYLIHTGEDVSIFMTFFNKFILITF